jgi:lactate permease
MEGAAGFGASVALAAPFLVAAGFRPVQAVTIALIGHVVGVSFGAIGTPVIPQIGGHGAERPRDRPRDRCVSLSPRLVSPGRDADRRAADHPGCERRMGHPGGGRRWRSAASSFRTPFSGRWWARSSRRWRVHSSAGLCLSFSCTFLGRPERRIAERCRGKRAASPRARCCAPPLRTSSSSLIVLISTVREPSADPAESGPEITWELERRFSGAMQPLYHPGRCCSRLHSGALLQRRPRCAKLVARSSDATRRSCACRDRTPPCCCSPASWFTPG